MTDSLNGGVFSAITHSFWIMAGLLCALAYADYALTILGSTLYLRRGRQFVVSEAYELNPVWRTAVEAGRYWNPRLLRVFGLCGMLAVALWGIG